MSVWEKITQEHRELTERLKVEGGHIYHRAVSNSGISGAMCFVPDVDLQRYQAHLRDAYTQGFKDGQEDMKIKIYNSPAPILKGDELIAPCLSI
jgi:hypothetical protein